MWLLDQGCPMKTTMTCGSHDGNCFKGIEPSLSYRSRSFNPMSSSPGSFLFALSKHDSISGLVVTTSTTCMCWTMRIGSSPKGNCQARFLRPLEMYRRLTSELLQRGGMQNSMTRDMGVQTEYAITGGPPYPWETSYVIVWTRLAHDYTNTYMPYIMKKNASVRALRDKVAWHFQHETDGVRLSSHNAPLPLCARIESIITSPVIIHMRRFEQAWDYSCRWPINWGDVQTSYIDTLDQWSEPPDPVEMEVDAAIPCNQIVERENTDGNTELVMDEEPMHAVVPRGGGAERQRALHRP